MITNRSCWIESLSSLRDFLFWWNDLPSHKWLGYFRNLEERWHPIQVKQKDKVGWPDVDAFETAINRSKRDEGFFVGFDYIADGLRERDCYLKADHAVIMPLTVKKILDEQIARKLA